MTERIEKLLNRIPGYTGYRQKESMRDDDKRLRDEIARELKQIVDTLSQVSGKLAENRQLDRISGIEKVIGAVRHLESRVSTASYGYGGIFSDRSVDEFALSQLKQFDVAFQERVAALTRHASRISSVDVVEQPQLDAMSKEISELNTLFDSRNDVIETASPTNDPDVLALLETPREITPQQRQLLSIRKGGTGAILGDNYQFTADIVLTGKSGDPLATLVELDRGPEWLAIIDDGTNVTAWRGELRETTGSIQGGVPASARVSGPQGTTSDSPASFTSSMTGSGDSAEVTMQIGVAGSNRAYSGSSVSLLDIQIFSEGQTS